MFPFRRDSRHEWRDVKERENLEPGVKEPWNHREIMEVCLNFLKKN